MKKYIVTIHTAVGDFEDDPTQEIEVNKVEMSIENFFQEKIKVRSGYWFENVQGDGRTWIPEHQIFGVSYREA